MVRFHCGQKDRQAAAALAGRAVALLREYGIERDQEDVAMDLIATHCNGCPLDFQKMLAADDFNLLHDVQGIYHSLDRKTGKLGNYFLPKCAKGEVRP